MRFEPFKSGHVHDARALRRTAFRVLSAFRAEYDLVESQRTRTAEALLGVPPRRAPEKTEVELHKEFFLSEVSEGLLQIALHARVFLDRLPDISNAVQKISCGILIERGQEKGPLWFRFAANKIIHASEVRFLLADDEGRRVPALATLGSSKRIHRPDCLELVGKYGENDWTAELHVRSFLVLSSDIFAIADRVSEKVAKLETEEFEALAIAAQQAATKSPSE